MIGIRLADRSLFPVLAEDTPGRRRVVLVTSRDDQVRALVELYRIVDDDGELLETIVVDNLPPRPGGDTELDLDMTVTADRVLLVRVQDGETGNVQSVSLDLDEYELFSDTIPVPPGDDSHDSDSAVFAAVPDSPSRTRRRWWPVVLIAVLLLGAAAALIFLLPRDRGESFAETPVPSNEPSAPQAVTPADEEPEPAPPSPTASEPPLEETPASEEPPSPQTEAPQPVARDESAASERTETEYRVQRGDTLWELSERFYGTPWAYPDIAEENDIANPDLIFPEDDITIPDGR